MVQELKVHEIIPTLSWEKEREYLLDFTQSGIPLPDEYKTHIFAQLNIYLGERDPAMVKAEKEWDLYWLHPASGMSWLTPGERLKEYFFYAQA